MKCFPINEKYSNIQNITNLAREGFGKLFLILVQANSLKIEDSLVIQCMFFVISILFMFIFIIFWSLIERKKNKKTLSVENMKKLKAWIRFKREKQWNTSRFNDTIYAMWNLVGNFFQTANWSWIFFFFFAALQFWKCSACKVFDIVKKEVLANWQSKGIGTKFFSKSPIKEILQHPRLATIIATSIIAKLLSDEYIH